jgi:Domain of unknown function (DUF4185)
MAYRSRLDRFGHALRGLPVIAGLLAAGCNPGAFDALAQRAVDAGDTRDTGSGEAGDAGDAGSVTAGDGAADGGESGRGDAGKGGAGASGTGAGGAGGAGSGGSAAGQGGAAAGSGGAAGSATMAGSGAAGAPTAPMPCTPATDVSKVTVSTSEVGEIAKPSWVENRTVVSSAFVRNRVLLLFSVPMAFGMAGWGSTQGLLSLPPRLEEQAPFVPLFDASAVPADRSVAIGSAVADGSSALVYFAAVNGFLGVEGAGLGRVSLNGNRAEVLRASGALFPPSGSGMDPWRPPFVSGAISRLENDVEYIYVYGCQANPNNPDEMGGGEHESPCRLARVPSTEAASGESYRYWSGSDWVADVSSAVVVIDHTAGGLSVSYNTFLQKFVAVNSGGINQVTMRWADRLQGPWMPLAQFGTVPASGGFGSTFSAVELPALRDTCQRVTYVSYAITTLVTQPDNTTRTDYATHLVRVELQ